MEPEAHEAIEHLEREVKRLRDENAGLMQAVNANQAMLERAVEQAEAFKAFIANIASQPCYRTETEAGGCAPCEAQSLLSRVGEDGA